MDNAQKYNNCISMYAELHLLGTDKKYHIIIVYTT
jgi:hypothetical protein